MPRTAWGADCKRERVEKPERRIPEEGRRSGGGGAAGLRQEEEEQRSRNRLEAGGKKVLKNMAIN